MKFRKVRIRLAALVGAAMLVASTAAQALLIDFTAETWQDSETGDSASAKTRTIGGIEVTVSAFSDLAGFVPGTLTFTNFDGNLADAPCGSLLACDTDGGGIGDDEITFGLSNDGNEALVVSFGQALNITRIHLLDLFAAPDGAGGDDEVAEFLADSMPVASYGTLTGTATDGTGYAATGDLGFAGVTMVAFFSTDIFGSEAPANSDFALAAIDVNVPEPETIALLGLGLLGLAGLARQSQATARA